MEEEFPHATIYVGRKNQTYTVASAKTRHIPLRPQKPDIYSCVRKNQTYTVASARERFASYAEIWIIYKSDVWQGLAGVRGGGGGGPSFEVIL